MLSRTLQVGNAFDPGSPRGSLVVATRLSVNTGRGTIMHRPTNLPGLNALRQRRPTLRNVNEQTRERLSPLDRFAITITTRVGTMGFFLMIATWSALWLGWNLLAPARLRFDPPMGFVLWLFISNLIQILLMPLIMVGQNIQGRHAEEPTRISPSIRRPSSRWRRSSGISKSRQRSSSGLTARAKALRQRDQNICRKSRWPATSCRIARLA